MDDHNTQKITLDQLKADFSELAFLCQKPLKLLQKFGQPGKTYDELMFRLLAIIRQTKSFALSTGTPEQLIAQKHLLKRELRRLYRLIPAFVMADEWQSPGYEFTENSYSGPLTGPVAPGLYDYKRDHHRLAKTYEAQFTREFLGQNPLKPLGCLLTNSGMSAAVTIITYLKSQKVQNVLMGRHTYFQLKELVHSHFSSVSEFSETDPAAFSSLLKTAKPQAVFVDSLSNDGNLVAPDLVSLTRNLKKISPRTFFVIDNAVGSLLRPVTKLISQNYSQSIIVFESLNKFHQYGFDLVTAGLISAKATLISRLFSRRRDAGTILDDLPTLTLPQPNRRLLENRLYRLTQNAGIFAAALNSRLPRKSPIKAILAQPCDQTAHPAPFVNFVFSPKYATPKHYQSFCRQIFNRCQNQGIELIGGTSFGLDHSRLYITAIRSVSAKPFVRFSPGTETLFELNRLIKVFLAAIPTGP